MRLLELQAVPGSELCLGVQLGSVLCRALALPGVVGHHGGFSKGVDALPHGVQDELQPPVQGQEVGFSEHRGQGVLQEGFPHHLAELVLGLCQQLQPQQGRSLYSGKKTNQHLMPPAKAAELLDSRKAEMVEEILKNFGTKVL